MHLPNASTLAKAVVMTAVSIAILRLIKPYAPEPIASLLP